MLKRSRILCLGNPVQPRLVLLLSKMRCDKLSWPPPNVCWISWIVCDTRLIGRTFEREAEQWRNISPVGSRPARTSAIGLLPFTPPRLRAKNSADLCATKIANDRVQTITETFGMRVLVACRRFGRHLFRHGFLNEWDQLRSRLSVFERNFIVSLLVVLSALICTSKRED